jgi:non-ribosomal peptide synthetase component F
MRQNVYTAVLSPRLLKQYLNSVPSMLRALDIIIIGRARLNSHNVVEVQALVPGGVYNAYGPTENTVISTIHNITKQELFVNGVPIGIAISNSGAYVIDLQQQLVSIRVIGELVVIGDGLARGYTDSELDRDRFIQVTIDGRLVRAYQTGDRMRYRRTDGQLEFFGRID